MIILEDFVERASIDKDNPKDVNMWPIDIGNTRISTDYAQKPP
jgi:hypothetical protein